MTLRQTATACFLMAAAQISVTATAFASLPGTLDSSFGGDGVVMTGFNPYDARAEAVLQQPDGKLVVAGYANATNPGTEEKQLVLVRYNSGNGSRDTTFNGNGVLQFGFSSGIRAEALAQQADGKLLVAGWVRRSGSSDELAVARIKTDGTLDGSFSGDGVATATVGNTNAHAFAVASRSDGSVLVAGYTSQAGTNGDDFMLVHYSSNGTLDNNFGSGGGVLTDIGSSTDRAYAIIKQSNGQIVLVGETSILANGVRSSDFGLARYSASGVLDTAFSSDGKQNTSFRTSDDAVARAGIQQADGKLVVVGASAPASGGDYDVAVARYLANGSLDTSFGSGGKVLTDIAGEDDVATGVTEQHDGKLLVSGSTGDGDGFLVRYNKDGSLDTGFGVGGRLVTTLTAPLVLNSMVQQADGQVVVAGYTYASGNYVMAVLRYLFDDDDGDGVVDTADNCQYVANPDQANHDSDAFGDACDDDDDNDGVPDSEDAFPFDPTESVDTDGDGIGNNADPDDDNDGVPDDEDPFPLDPFLLGRVNGNKADLAGYSVAFVGDVDGDGFADILVGAPKTDVLLPGKTKKSTDAGFVELVSGKTLGVLATFHGAAKGDEFGTTVAALGDVDDDGVPDFAIGAPKADETDPDTGKVLMKDRGTVNVYSGANYPDCADGECEPLYALHGEASGDNFGIAIAATGDINADNHADILVGAWKADGFDPVTQKPLKDTGVAYLYNGEDGSPLHKFSAVDAKKSDYFGYSLAAGADLDHDGIPDIAIGAYRHDPVDGVTGKPRTDAGSVYVYSSAAPYDLVTRLDGAAKGDNFGFALAAVNEGQDAFRDLVVGSPKADAVIDKKKYKDAGSIALFADASGAALYGIRADTPQAGALFGSALAAAGDVDASGVEDFVVGAPKTDVVLSGKKLKDAGQVTVHSAAASGATVFRVDGGIAKGQTGFSVAGHGDFNHDGYDDVLIGSPYAVFNKLTKAGIAEVISGKEAAAAVAP